VLLVLAAGGNLLEIEGDADDLLSARRGLNCEKRKQRKKLVDKNEAIKIEIEHASAASQRCRTWDMEGVRGYFRSNPGGTDGL
jgi:hypothetical protein